MPDPDDLLDGCDVVLDDEGTTTDDEAELLPLFAVALDPTNDVTIEERRAEWEELFGEPSH